MDRVEIAGNGPLRARVRLSGSAVDSARTVWDFTWFSGSPVLSWHVGFKTADQAQSHGFFFSCLSAVRYLPFTRWMEGVELDFPDGWETDNALGFVIGRRDGISAP